MRAAARSLVHTRRGRCAWTATRWSPSARSRRRCRGGRRGRRWRSWRTSAPTRGPRGSTSRSAPGGCARPAASRGGRTRRWPWATRESPVPAALEAVRAFADRHGVAAAGARAGRVAVGAGGGGRGLGARRRARGGRRGGGAGGGRRPARSARTPRVVLAERPDDAWWALALGREPTPDERCVLDPGSHAVPDRRCARPSGCAADAGRGPRRRRRRAPAPVAARRPPAARRAGHRHRADGRGRRGWGREQGARWAVLQVGAAQHRGAGASTTRLGATEHHRYRYLVPPPDR